MPIPTETKIEEWIGEILSSHKYRNLQIPRETLLDLFSQIPGTIHDQKAIRKNVKEKLHHIVAPYLGDLDYPRVEEQLNHALQETNPEKIKSVCQDILSNHASTKERLGVLETFYRNIFDLTSKPSSILDLACGLNPFAFPWMGLPVSTQYHAFDIHLPRIYLINHFFTGSGLQPLAVQQDIIAQPPGIPADVAFIFKEAHRMEQRQRGCSRTLWQRLNVHWLVITLPAFSLTGKHDLTSRHRQLVCDCIRGFSWRMQEMIIGKEMVFCINKSP